MMTKKVIRFWGKNGVYPAGKILNTPMFHVNDRKWECTFSMQTDIPPM